MRFEAGVDPADRAAIRDSVEAEFLRSYSLVPRLQLLELPAGTDRGETIETLESEPGIAYAEPDLIRHIEVTIPNDTFYRSPNFYLWGLNNTGQSFTVGSTGYTGTPDADIDAPEAWDLTRGSSSVTVAVIDSGMQLNHPDLASNLWTNPNETPGNGIDDDANGRIDDVNGWDFVNSDNDPTDDDGHGTHVAGTIGAVGNNNSGVTGVAWNVKLMPLKACNAAGSCAISATIAALNYAVAQGVKISNNSYGGISGQSTSERNAITAARDAGHLFVAAAGNDGVNTDVPANAHYPSNYNLDNIISVASTTLNDGLSSFSNYGTTSVDLGAPGSQILSTYPTSSYVWANGTSMASPHVAGVAALVKSRKPDWTYSQVRSRLIDNTRPLASLSGTTVTGGMLNAYSALLFAPDPPTIGSGASGFVSSTSASFSFTGETVGAGVTFECRIDSGSWGSCSSPKSYTSLSQGSHTFEVRQTDQAGNVSTEASRTWTVDTFTLSAPSITQGPEGEVNSVEASFEFSGVSGATFECRLDDGPFETCSSPFEVADLDAGPHELAVKQTDSIGNVSEAAIRSWTVLEVATVQPQLAGTNETGEVVFEGAPDGFTYLCAVGSEELHPCESPYIPTGLTDGSYPIQIVIEDPEGNLSAPTETELVIEGTPQPPEGEPSIIVNGGAVYGRTVEVELGIIWPTGARRAVISNASEPPGQSTVLSPSIPWTLATGQGARTVTVEFIGAGDVPLGTASDSIFLDPNRPSLKSAKVRKNRGKVWWTAVKATDSGSGLSKLAWSTRRSRPGTNAVPAKIVNFTKSSTVKTRLPSRPRWAKVRDRAGNWSGWRAVKPR